MKPPSCLAFAGNDYVNVRQHLFPGDGKEAAAILLCSNAPKPRKRLLVRRVLLIPYAECSVRETDKITWPGSYLEKAIDIAEQEDLTIMLLHSHPGGWLDFSSIDDASDLTVIPCLFEALGNHHGSAIMIPDGAIRARIYSPDMCCEQIDMVTVSGDDLEYWWNDQIIDGAPPKRPRAFTGEMTEVMSRLSVAVIGASGTGSIVAELFARLGIGKITLVDFDEFEAKNLNRILNSTLDDVGAKRNKAQMLRDFIHKYRYGEVVSAFPMSINNRDAIIGVGQCDFIVCCVDTQEARQIADLISSAFLMPLFDVGVVIPTRTDGVDVQIADACGRIDYVQPGGSNLRDREVYSSEGLRAEYLRNTDPEAFRNEVAEGYIKGLLEEAPSVITLNMRAAATAANEFIARAFPFRHEPNRLYARTSFSIAACDEDYFAEDEFPSKPDDDLGRGVLEPLLGLPSLKAPKVAEQ